MRLKPKAKGAYFLGLRVMKVDVSLTQATFGHWLMAN